MGNTLKMFAKGNIQDSNGVRYEAGRQPQAVEIVPLPVLSGDVRSAMNNDQMAQDEIDLRNSRPIGLFVSDEEGWEICRDHATTDDACSTAATCSRLPLGLAAVSVGPINGGGASRAEREHVETSSQVKQGVGGATSSVVGYSLRF